MEFLLNAIKANSNHLFSILLIATSAVVLNTSCDKNNALGLEISPESQAVSTFLSDTFNLNTSTILSDSIRTDGLNGPSPLGNYIDPVFGEVNSSIYTQIRIEQSIDFRPDNGSLDSLVVDSVVMYLALNGYYGDISEQTFIVSEITEDLYTDSSYYNNTELTAQTNNLCVETSIESNPLFPGYFAGELVDQAILRIPLSISDFALPIMNESGNPTLDGNDGDDEFLSYFKGLKISATNGIDGGLYYVDMLNAFTRIRLFYRDTSGTSADHDTLDFDFNINSNCAFFHHVDHLYNGTVVEEAISQPSNGQDQFYVQALGGVNGIATIPHLNELLDSQVIINKAEIILPCDNYAFDNFNAPSYLFITRRNEDGEYAFLPDFLEGNLDGSYNSITKNYSFNITRHVNEIMADKVANDTLKIFPTGGGISANRIILNGMNSSKKNKAKAVITYTKY